MGILNGNQNESHSPGQLDPAIYSPVTLGTSLGDLLNLSVHSPWVQLNGRPIWRRLATGWGMLDSVQFLEPKDPGWHGWNSVPVVLSREETQGTIQRGMPSKAWPP